MRLRSAGDPVLSVANPPGITAPGRRRQLDALAALNAEQFAGAHAPEITSRIAAYKLAFRMQTRVPELLDVAGEPWHVHDLHATALHPLGMIDHERFMHRFRGRDVRLTDVHGTVVAALLA